MLEIANASEAIFVTAALTGRWYGDTGLPTPRSQTYRAQQPPAPGSQTTTATSSPTSSRTVTEQFVDLVPKRRSAHYGRDPSYR